AAAAAAFFAQAARIAGVHCAAVAAGQPAAAASAAVLDPGRMAEQPPSSGTAGVGPAAWAADAVVAEVAEVAEVADLEWSHASAAAALHVLARSTRASSRSDFMEPTSRKVMTPGTRPERASPDQPLRTSAGHQKACHRPMGPVSGMCKKDPPDARCDVKRTTRVAASTLRNASQRVGSHDRSVDARAHHSLVCGVLSMVKRRSAAKHRRAPLLLGAVAAAALLLFLTGELLAWAASDSGRLAGWRYLHLGDRAHAVRIIGKQIERGLVRAGIAASAIESHVEAGEGPALHWKVRLPREGAPLLVNHRVTRAVESGGAEVLSGHERVRDDGTLVVTLLVGVPGRATHLLEILRPGPPGKPEAHA